MNKQANIQKAIALMKSQGMSAEKALKAVYPDWDEAKIQKAAMTIRTMDKTASVMKISSAMAKLAADEAAEGKPKQKITFSPAMDKSPLLIGKQSKLPDQIQAKILKGKMKKEQPIKDKMASAVSLIGLQYASNAMFANHVRKATGQEKTANAIMKMLGAPSTASWMTRGGAIGGLAAGSGEALRLWRLAQSGKAGKAGVGLATKESVAANKALLKSYKAAGGMKGNVGAWLKANPGKAFEIAGGSIGKNMLTGAAAGATTGGVAAKSAQAIAKSKAIATAKKVAVPAAIGAGGYALLS